MDGPEKPGWLKILMWILQILFWIFGIIGVIYGIAKPKPEIIVIVAMLAAGFAYSMLRRE